MTTATKRRKRLSLNEAVTRHLNEQVWIREQLKTAGPALLKKQTAGARSLGDISRATGYTVAHLCNLRKGKDHMSPEAYEIIFNGRRAGSNGHR